MTTGRDGVPAAMSILDRVSQAASATGGAVLATSTRTLAAVRGTAKPLHPEGELVVGTLSRVGLTPPLGVPWLDQAGEDQVLVRRSRSVGLPDGLPDVHGLAVRVPLDGGGHGDLLLASTGRGPLTRFLLAPTREPGGRTLTTLLPYRTVAGPVLLAAREVAPGHFGLACAVGRGEWRAFADLTLSAGVGDPLVSFDPGENQVPGLEQYPWVRRLRAPSYRRARGSRERP